MLLEFIIVSFSETNFSPIQPPVRLPLRAALALLYESPMITFPPNLQSMAMLEPIDSWFTLRRQLEITDTDLSQ